MWSGESSKCWWWCGRSESNRHSFGEQVFETCASTNSATPACQRTRSGSGIGFARLLSQARLPIPPQGHGARIIPAVRAGSTPECERRAGEVLTHS
jgi:hypothetical protein